MTRRVRLMLLAFVLASAAATAQEKPEPRPGARPQPLKLQITFTKFQNEKKVSSVPYTLSMSPEYWTRVRMGIDVPMSLESAGGKQPPGNIVYKTIGNNIDCYARPIDQGRYEIRCSFSQSSVSGNQKGVAGDGSSLMPPVLRTFSSDASLILSDGQSAQHTVATDPVSGEVLKVDVTLTVVK